MQHVLRLLVFVLMAVPVYAQARFDMTMIVDSVQREFIVSRPSGPVPPGGYPVVFMFHGTSGDGERFYNISGWKEKGETEKFLSVFPSSLRYCFIDSGRQVQTTKWNSSEAQEKACPGQYLKDDVHFIRRIIDTLVQTIPIDRSRLYASGFSNGATFTSKLAVEMSDVFAAVAAAAGGLGSSDSAAPKRYLPIAFSIGAADEHLTEPTGIPEVPFNDSCMNYIGGMVRRFLGAFNLDTAHVKDSTALSLTYVFTTPASPSLPSSLLTCTLLNGLAHQYPNGRNYPLTAAEYLWEFFKRHTLPLTSASSPPAPATIRIYPNPASTYLVVEGHGEMNIVLRNMLGQVVYSTPAMMGSRISLPRLTPGIYTSEIVERDRRAFSLVAIR